MKVSLMVRRSGQEEWRILWDGYKSYKDAADARTGWQSNYPTFRDASFRIMELERGRDPVQIFR